MVQTSPTPFDVRYFSLYFKKKFHIVVQLGGPCIRPSVLYTITSGTSYASSVNLINMFFFISIHLFFLIFRFYSTDSTFIHGGVDRPGCVEQPAVGPDNISQRINDLNLRDCHAKIRQVDSHPTIGDGVVVQVNFVLMKILNIKTT